MTHTARQWLDLAAKVTHYRRDILPARELAELQAQTQSLRTLVREQAEPAKLKLGVESLEACLRRSGGNFYPKRSLAENVEFFLVAAIVVLGFRTYFVQPFKIPTNSMWPSYYGMTAQNLPPDQPSLGLITRAFRFVAFGAQRREALAPASGQVSADFFENGELAYTIQRGRSWLIFPALVKQYTFYVDGQPVSFTVPQDFHSVNQVMLATFFDGDPAVFDSYLRKVAKENELTVRMSHIQDGTQEYARVVRVPLPRTVQQGIPVIRFDILTGDQLFVDRFSFNFVRPQVGEGFVFRTGQIHSPYMRDPLTGRQIDEYYIKRLVGLPGDTLEIKDYTLYRNGAPITGAAAFAKNARRSDHYVGYRNLMSLGVGETMTVPPNHFLALGDNSADSKDGRYWGYVPAKEAVGRPLFIYYPFTKRWGPAR